MIKRQPNTPAMMIKGEREQDSENKKNSKGQLWVHIEKRNGNQINEQQDGFREYDAHKDGADKETFFPFEVRSAKRAVV
jgi:hypothetical protein